MEKVASQSSINFHINAKLGFGESIHISGNIAGLGDNNPKKSLELYTTPEKCMVPVPCHF